MQSRLLHDADGQRTFAIVLKTGDEAIGCLQAFARRERLSAAQFTAIGAFGRATLGYFDWEQKDYVRNQIEEQVEVASLIGDVALAQAGEPALHVHVVLGRRNGNAIAGHLLDAEVRPPPEIVLDGFQLIRANTMTPRAASR